MSVNKELENIVTQLHNITYINGISTDLYHLLEKIQSKVNILSNEDVTNILEQANIVHECNKTKNINNININKENKLIANIEKSINNCKQKEQNFYFSPKDLLSITGWNAALDKFLEVNYHGEQSKNQEFKAQDQAVQRLIVSKWFANYPEIVQKELEDLTLELNKHQKIRDNILQNKDDNNKLDQALSKLEFVLNTVNKAINQTEENLEKELDWKILIDSSGAPVFTPSVFNKQQVFMREIILKRTGKIDNKLKKKKVKKIAGLSSEEFTDFYLSINDFLDPQGNNLLTVDCLNLDLEGRKHFYSGHPKQNLILALSDIEYKDIFAKFIPEID